MVDAADQFHVAEPALELFFYACRQFFGRKVLNAVDFIGIDCNDGIGQALFQWQQCDGASVMEAFVSGMLVGKGMFHAADEHGSAVVVHI